MRRNKLFAVVLTAAILAALLALRILSNNDASVWRVKPFKEAQR